MKKLLFSTCIFTFNNAFSVEYLNQLIDSVKEKLTDEDYTGEYVNGPEYETSYHLIQKKGNKYEIEDEKIINDINNQLQKEYCHVEKIDPLWYAEYGPHDFHFPHNHNQYQYNMIKMQDPRKFYYSFVINLSDIGSTVFSNPNFASLTGSFGVKSKKGSIILFPSNILHFASPHRISGQIRKIISGNVILTFDDLKYI